MDTYSCCFNGHYAGSRSASAYYIFKNGEFFEEKVIPNDAARNITNQQVLALKILLDRLIELGIEDVTINSSFKEAYDRVMKAHNQYVVKKDSIPTSMKNSNILYCARIMKQFKNFKWNVVPKKDNLRARFLSRKIKERNFNYRLFYWKGEFPENTL